MTDTRLFHEQGYQVIRGLLPSDVLREVGDFLRSEADRALEQLCSLWGLSCLAQIPAKINSLADDRQLQRMDPALRQIMSGHFPLETRLSRRLWAIPRLTCVQAMLRQALRYDELFMHMPPTARFVLPGNVHAGVPAHQDVSYNRHMTDFLTLWVPFTVIDEQCGGVTVFPGSERQPELPTDATQRFWRTGVPTAGYERIHCIMNPGDALLLNPWIIHESAPNRSQRTRISIDFRFFSGRSASLKHCLDLRRWTVLEPPLPRADVA